MEEVRSSSSVTSPVEKEIIDLDEESDYDDDDDRVRQDMYEDYDELADLAVTASEEPPPPGTRPLQEELLTLITENTVSGVTINKDDVVTWLRNEEAALTGENTQIVPHRLYPSPPSSVEKYSDDDLSDASRSGQSPPKKKSKKLTSVAVKQDQHDHSRDSSRHRERSPYRERSHHGVRSHDHRRGAGRREGSRPRDISRNHDSSYRSEGIRHRSRERREERIQSREATPLSNSRHRSSTSQHPRAEHKRRNQSLQRESSRDSVPRRQNLHHGKREDSGTRRQPSLTRHDDCRQSSPRRRGDSRQSSPRSRSISRRVKVQHRIVDENNKTPQYKEVRSTTQKSRGSRVESVAGKLGGIRDARELISDRRTAVPVPDYIKSLKDQILNSEKNARHMFKELQSAKRHLLDYLQVAEMGDTDKDRGGNSDRHEERKRVCRRQEQERPRDRARDETRDRVKSRDETRRKSQDKKRSRDHRRPSPERESRKSSSRKSSPIPDRGSEDPSQWKVIPPSEVDGFNCGGPAIFVQNFSRSVSKKHLYNHFLSFGAIVDITKLDIGRKRIKSACVIFSRQSEADKVLKSTSIEQECPVFGGLDLPTPPSTFDLLLTALKSDQPGENVVAAVR